MRAFGPPISVISRDLSRQDLAVGLGLAALAVIEVGAGRLEGPVPLLLPVSLAATLPLVWRRRVPVAASTVTIAAIVGLAIGSAIPDDPPAFALIAFLVAAYSPPAHADGWRAVAGAAVALAGMTVFILPGDHGAKLSDAAFGYTEVAIAWVVGRTVHHRQRRADRMAQLARELESDREEDARRLLAEERGRIARELHDVVAHGVSLMVVQAQAGRRVIERDAARAEESFEEIERAGRQALGELERMLGVMRADHVDAAELAPQPGLRQLDDLIEHARAAGVDVEVEIRGGPRPLSRGLDLAAYRIVQEALTNVVKHGGGGPTQVTVTYGAHELELRIANAPGAALGATASRNGGGHGLIGMRERAALYDGELETGPGPKGGYVVRARLPLVEQQA